MTHDDVIKPGDVPTKHPGEGKPQQFRCNECNQPKSMPGRRLVRVLHGSMKGARAMVCAECIAAREPA